jgi:hypothetical protein
VITEQFTERRAKNKEQYFENYHEKEHLFGGWFVSLQPGRAHLNARIGGRRV